jgi:hypothetical protein
MVYFLVVQLMFSFAFATDTNELPPSEVFGKCYEKITDLPVDIHSSIYKDVESGKTDPVTACMSVFKNAQFKVVDNHRMLRNTADEVSVSILRNFHQFHLSWFTSGALGGALGSSNFQYNDNDEPGLYVTDSLFSNKAYSSVMTSSEPLRGVRDGNVPDTYFIANSNFTDRIPILAPAKTGKLAIVNNFVELTGTRVSLGSLVGISRAPQIIMPLPANVGVSAVTEANLTSRQHDGTSVDITGRSGGGVLGSFVLLQNNMESGVKLDGGLHVHRRWASNFMTNMLCASLPSLRSTDAPVQRELAMFSNSSLSFRKSSTCLACHTTLDNLAHVTRNMDMVTSISGVNRRLIADAFPGKNFIDMPLAMTHKVRSPAAAVSDNDPLYIRRPPKGALVFRDYNNNLVNESVNGLQELGAAIAKREDMYVCAAKRYYYFLTGVDIPLTPIAIDSVTKKNKYPSDNFNFYHREKIVSLGKALKKDGSLMKLMENILRTPTFKARNAAQVGDQ